MHSNLNGKHLALSTDVAVFRKPASEADKTFSTYLYVWRSLRSADNRPRQ